MGGIKSLVAKFLSFTLMSSSCFASKTNALRTNKNFNKKIEHFRDTKKKNNFKRKSKQTKVLRGGSNLHKKDIESSLKIGSSADISSNALKNSNKTPKYKNEKGSVKIVKDRFNFVQKKEGKIASEGLEKTEINANRNKFLENFLKMTGKTGNLIKNNPFKTAIVLSALMYGVAKFGDVIGSDTKVFNEFETFVNKYMGDLASGDTFKYDGRYTEMRQEFESDKNLDFLFSVCTFLSYKLDGSNYSQTVTGIRRVWDMFLFSGATTRERKSAQRLMSNGKGSCWEAAFTFDFCLRMYKKLKIGLGEIKKIGRHYIVISHLSPSIYHIFNLFEYDGNWYFCDPLAGVMEKISEDGVLNHEYLKKYIKKIKYTGLNVGDFRANYNHETNQTLNLYVLEQINQSNKIKPLGMMKMAPFMTSDRNDRTSFMIQNEEGKYVKNNDVKFDKSSSLLFG